ncbi:MAG: phosphoribosylglycinamide formyltransferase, partial [Alphaproteobacteria bacterium]|nr:phosphoribosylglycinamide formyltransferase [Alphaproteobacteria bacterium]
ISNQPGASGIALAQARNIAVTIIPHHGKTREQFDTELDATLRQHGIELVCLAGFMRILSDGFVRAWQGRLINIHPSLLPAFKGINVQAQALAAGVRVSGCTVHFVVPELDSGPIIEQACVRVDPKDTEETLAARILEEEHRIYPQALRLVASGRVRLEGGRAIFS